MPHRGYGPLQVPTRRAMILRVFHPLQPLQGCLVLKEDNKKAALFSQNGFENYL